MRYRIAILFLPILLACMTTVEPYQTYPAETPTIVQTSAPSPATPKVTGEPDSGAVFIQIVPRCATVTADKALHIRAEPNEHAQVLGYLHNGDVVVIIQSTGKWWKIAPARGDYWTPLAGVDSGPLQGYSKAEFLKESECK